MEVLGKTCKVLDYSLDDIMEFEEEKGVGRNNNENLFKKSYITFVGLFIVTIVIGAIYTECWTWIEVSFHDKDERSVDERMCFCRWGFTMDDIQ